MLKKYEEILILEPIYYYFNTYYENLKTGIYRDISRWFIVNDDTVIPRRLIQNKYKLYHTFNLRIKEYQLDLNILNIDLYKDHARVFLTENIEYNLNNSKEVKTKMTGIEYMLMLKKIDGLWKIIYMDSNQETYHLGEKKRSIDRVISKDNTQLTKKGHILNKVFDDLDREIYYLTSLNQNFIPMTFTQKENKILQNSFSYNSNNGVLYAKEYANYKKVAEDKKLFYYASNGSDCANFVSQCVWAGYGGYAQNETKQTRENIANKVRMVKTSNQSTSWYGTGVGGGGTPNWENVNQFYKYATMQKSVGPKGTGYGGCLQSEFNFSQIAVGDVLQFWKKSQNKWYHSAYVSSIGLNGKIEEIFICQHSIDIINRPLVDLLMWNTNEGQLRGIHFTSATFNQ